MFPRKVWFSHGMNIEQIYSQEWIKLEIYRKFTKDIDLVIGPSTSSKKYIKENSLFIDLNTTILGVRKIVSKFFAIPLSKTTMGIYDEETDEWKYFYFDETLKSLKFETGETYKARFIFLEDIV